MLGHILQFGAQAAEGTHEAGLRAAGLRQARLRPHGLCKAEI